MKYYNSFRWRLLVVKWQATKEEKQCKTIQIILNDNNLFFLKSAPNKPLSKKQQTTILKLPARYFYSILLF